MKVPLSIAGILVCLATAALVTFLVIHSSPQGRDRPVHAVRASSTSATSGAPEPLPSTPPGDPRRLAVDIARAQQIIDDRMSSASDLDRAGLFEQLATGSLAGETARARRTTLAQLRGQAAVTTRTDLAAAAALSRITPPEKRFPPWRIANPPASNILLGYFREGQSRFRVAWEYLAAIEFIETRFGRVHGLSPAGAEGPMQFMPTTWARYGTGNVDDQRDAILGAARYLAASGAPGDVAGALYHYNDSPDYVAAVEDYAGEMRADPRAYDGYYTWRVIYARVGGAYILPVGYPAVRPERLH
jgi:hypothetical protein